ncbi:MULTISPECIES: serine/threonine protein kinase [Nocardiopsidaceae]|uniref:DNA translocase FtsK n=1 Tax=Streptomonospora nanhaiensis TaxID=1323731 RepID=A0ABY6YHZ4_9ACTN|nr:serine/threonine protein kinase [Streptomonospora nanhaiensis]WAE71902.1 DNA translocase FtsK [Streptomonospora nanhaiensis]
MYGGTELDGRYRLEKHLGSGGMGEVWGGLDLKLRRAVAVKLLPLRHSDPSRMDRFRREAEIAAAFQDPGITVVHDTGESHGFLYVVMEKVDGEDLKRLLDRHPDGLPVEQVLDIGLQVAEALIAAHGGNVAHRDVKPSNIMLTPRGQVKICDFGVARVLEDNRGEQGTAGIGTAVYMAPEQFDGVVGIRSDLYSLGCVLYELVTGFPPFRGTPHKLMDLHRRALPASFAECRRSVPAGLEALVTDLLGKRPEERPANAEEVRDRLKRIVRGHDRGSDAVHHDSRTAMPTGPKPAVPPASEPFTPPSPRLLASGSPAKKHTPHNSHVMSTVQSVLARSNVDAHVAGCVRGPVVSRYEIRLPSPESASCVGRLVEQISVELGGVDVEFLAFVRSTSALPGGTAVGLEIINADPEVIGLGDLLRSAPAPQENSSLLYGLGRGAAGPVLVNLEETPHLLITGARGTGKSMAIRAAVTSLLVRATPEEVRLVLVDSPGGRLSVFDDVPHLLFPVTDDPARAVVALRWVEEEMERRYDDLASHGHRTVHGYNVAVREGRTPPPARSLGTRTPHPSIVVFVDEVTVLTDRCREETEHSIGSLARLARAVGIHLVLATREVHTGALTERVHAYIPSRLTFRTTSVEGGEVTVDDGRTTRLRGSGDALFLPRGAKRPTRLRTSLVSQGDLTSVVDHWRRPGHRPGR